MGADDLVAPAGTGGLAELALVLAHLGVEDVVGVLGQLVAFDATATKPPLHDVSTPPHLDACRERDTPGRPIPTR